MKIEPSAKMRFGERIMKPVGSMFSLFVDLNVCVRHWIVRKSTYGQGIEGGTRRRNHVVRWHLLKKMLI